MGRRSAWLACCLGAALAAGCPADDAVEDTVTPDADAVVDVASDGDDARDASDASDGADADAQLDVPAETVAEVTDTVDATETEDGGNADGDGGSDAQDVDETEASPTTVTLIDNASWAEVLLDADPFHDPADPTPNICPAEDWKSEFTPEGLLLEINTTFCAYLTLSQPLLDAIPAGAEVTLEVRHDEVLDGDGDYQLAVALGDGADMVWSETVALFDLPDEFVYTFTADKAYEAGEPVYFHLGNHGVNTWNFVALTATF